MIQIKNRYTGAVIHEGDYASILECLSAAIKSGADLYGADLSRANLSGAKNAELVIAQTRILPEGDLIGYKKCLNDVIVKLLIPANAKRSHAFGRKCRAEFAKVLEIFGADEAISTHDKKNRLQNRRNSLS